MESNISPAVVERARTGEAGRVAHLLARMYEPFELPFTIWASPRIGRYVADLMEHPDPEDIHEFSVLRRGNSIAGAIHLRRIDGAIFVDGIYTDPASRKDQLSNFLVHTALTDYGRYGPFAVVRFDGAESKPAVRAWHRRVLGAAEAHRRTWWRMPLPAAGNAHGRLSGMDRADRDHDRWGFSSVTVTTSLKSYTVGRLPGPYFRLADADGARDRELLGSLAALDSSRELCVIGTKETQPEGGWIIDTFVRSQVDFPELLRRLKAQIPFSLMKKDPMPARHA